VVTSVKGWVVGNSNYNKPWEGRCQAHADIDVQERRKGPYFLSEVGCLATDIRYVSCVSQSMLGVVSTLPY
jgi:hypothetical protein